MMRIAVLAPIQSSLYSRLVVHLAAGEPGVKLTDVIVRTPWTRKRIASEFRRDGMRLLWKAYRKLILRDNAYQRGGDNIQTLARSCDLPGKTLRDLQKVHGFRLTVVKDHNDRRAQRVLQDGRPDAIAFTGGGLIRREILQIPGRGILNCHLGLLPQYRGMDVVEWPLVEPRPAESSPPLGLTVHFMDQGLDTGPVLLKQPFTAQPGQSFREIREKLEPRMVKLMLRAICGLRDGTLEAEPQEADAGRQYYVMHPRIFEYATRCLEELKTEAEPSKFAKLLV